MSVTTRTGLTSLWESWQPEVSPHHFSFAAMLAGKDHLSFVKAINNNSLSGTPWAFVDSHGDRQLAGEDLADTVGLPDAGVGDMRQAIGLAKAETGPAT